MYNICIYKKRFNLVETFKQRIMTPREKAEELFSEMYLSKDPLNKYPMCFDTAKECALNAVDQIIKEISYLQEVYSIKDKHLEYWQEVKTEINAL